MSASRQSFMVDIRNLPRYIVRMRTKPQEAAAAPKPRQNRRFVFLLNVAQRRLQRWMSARAQGGVTGAQSGLLFVLGQRDGVLMGEAGAALDLGAPGISGLVERMIEAKLIQ